MAGTPFTPEQENRIREIIAEMLAQYGRGANEAVRQAIEDSVAAIAGISRLAGVEPTDPIGAAVATTDTEFNSLRNVFQQASQPKRRNILSLLLARLRLGSRGGAADA